MPGSHISKEIDRNRLQNLAAFRQFYHDRVHEILAEHKIYLTLKQRASLDHHGSKLLLEQVQRNQNLQRLWDAPVSTTNAFNKAAARNMAKKHMDNVLAIQAEKNSHPRFNKPVAPAAKANKPRGNRRIQSMTSSAGRQGAGLQDAGPKLPVKDKAPKSVPRSVGKVPQKRQGPSAAESAALAIMLPHEKNDYRYSSKFTSVDTAIAQPFDITNDDWSHVQPSGALLPDGTYFAAVSRSPIYSKIQYVQNPEAKNWGYRGRFVSNPAVTVPAPPGPEPVEQYVFLHNRDPYDGVGEKLPLVWMDDKFPGNDTALHPHGDRLYAGDHDGRRGIPLMGNVSGGYSRINFVVEKANGSELSLPLPFVIFAYLLVGAEWVRRDQQDGILPPDAGVAGVCSINIQTPGYYAFEIRLADEASGTAGWIGVKCNTDSNTSCFAHSPLPYLAGKQATVGSYRCTGVSIMVSPQAAAFKEQGRFAGLQLPYGQSWTEIAFSGDAIQRASQSHLDSYSNGMYAFMKPTDDDEFEMHTPFRQEALFVVDVDSPLLPIGGWLCIKGFTGLDNTLGTPSYSSGVTYTTTCHAVEFTTLDVWFQQAKPVLDDRAFDGGLRLVRDVPQFHDNPIHVDEILRWVKARARETLHMAAQNAPLLLVPGLAAAMKFAFPSMKYAVAVALSRQMDEYWRSDGNGHYVRR